MGRWRTVGGAALLLTWGAGCLAPSREWPARLAEGRREAEDFSAALDRLEERLLLGRAKVFHWRELAERHQRVSALSCKGQEGHLAEMVALFERQRARREKRVLAGAKLRGGIGGP